MILLSLMQQLTWWYLQLLTQLFCQSSLILLNALIATVVQRYTTVTYVQKRWACLWTKPIKFCVKRSKPHPLNNNVMLESTVIQTSMGYLLFHIADQSLCRWEKKWNGAVTLQIDSITQNERLSKVSVAFTYMLCNEASFFSYF